MKKNKILLACIFHVGVAMTTPHHHTPHHHSSHHAPTHNTATSTPQQPVAPSNNPNNGGQQPYNPNNDGQQPYDPNAQNQAGGIGMANPNTLDQRTIVKTLDSAKARRLISKMETLRKNADTLSKIINDQFNAYRSDKTNFSLMLPSLHTTSLNQNDPTSHWKIDFLNKSFNPETQIIDQNTGKVLPGIKSDSTVNPIDNKQLTFADEDNIKYICKTLKAYCENALITIAIMVTAQYNAAYFGGARAEQAKQQNLHEGKQTLFVNKVPETVEGIIRSYPRNLPLFNFKKK